MNRRKYLLAVTILYAAVLVPAASLCKSGMEILKEKKKAKEEKEKEGKKS